MMTSCEPATPAMTAQAPARAASISRRERQVIAAQVHVSTALLLAAGLLFSAGGQLHAAGRWELQWILLVAAGLALVHAVAPWLLDGYGPRAQRTGIWQALVLAALPAAASMTTIGFAAVGACQLLLLAAVLAELGARRRVLLFLWAVAAVIFAVSLWHLRDPWL